MARYRICDFDEQIIATADQKQESSVRLESSGKISWKS